MTTSAYRRPEGHGEGRYRTAITTDPAELPAAAGSLLQDGYRLALVSATHRGPQDTRGEATHAVYLFLAGPPDSRIELRVPLDPAKPQVPSLAASRSRPGGSSARCATNTASNRSATPCCAQQHHLGTPGDHPADRPSN
jgi:hypothetical protein